MTNKKFLSGILCVALLISTFAMSASAISFSDVEDDPSVEWAKPYINDMADMGYIKGYDDGTFKPNKPVSKTESLILAARMIGVDNEDFADSVDCAVEEYTASLSKYKTDYAREVAFLLYMGVLDTSDLDDYLTNSNKNEPLKRYEAAVLLTKLMGATEEVENNIFATLAYADTDDIPIEVHPYVEYVNDRAIMQGVGNDENGKPLFAPNVPVTRSQIAKMLFTIIDVLDVTLETGVVVSTDSFHETITIDVDGTELNYSVDGRTVYKINGETVSFEDLTEGMLVKLTYISGKVALVENVVILEDTVVTGLIASVKESGSTKSITIADTNDKKKTSTYLLAKNAKVRIGGAVDTFNKLKANNYVSITVQDGLATEISVIEKSTSTIGTLVYIDATSDNTVLGIEDNKGTTTEYEISVDGVQVTRNNLDSNLAALMVGDAVSAKMTYGKITKISATSKNQTISGKISSITHAVSGTTLAIEISGKVREYKVNKSVSVLINSSDEGTVYDLRPGTDISLDLESNEIIAIKAASTIEKSHLAGTVVSVNANYGLLVVEEDGVEYNVFCNNSTKILDSVTAKSVALKSLEKGRGVIITGSNASGLFEATTIILQ